AGGAAFPERDGRGVENHRLIGGGRFLLRDEGRRDQHESKRRGHQEIWHFVANHINGARIFSPFSHQSVAWGNGASWRTGVVCSSLPRPPERSFLTVCMQRRPVRSR